MDRRASGRHLFWRKLAGLHDAVTSARFAGAAALGAAIAFAFC